MRLKEGLGWRFGDWKADYKISLPRLSEEEQQLVSLVIEQFRQEAEKKEIPDVNEARKLASELLLSICQAEGIELEKDQKDYLAEFVFLHTWGHGFLQPLLADQRLEEIAIIGIGLPVYVYKREIGWLKTNVALESQEYFVSLVNKLGRNLGRRLTAQNPRINAVLEDGSRLHASMPPVSSCELTIRKFTAEPLSPFDLAKSTYTPEIMALLSLCMQADMTIMVAGNTASGKTSTLNALLSFVPFSERLLLIEETPEISVPHPHQIRMLPFEEGNIGMVELVRDSLRMRPDRVVVGEIRSASEAVAFVESTLSGQAKGCYSTFHAATAHEAMLRMRMMGCMEQDLQAIDMILVQRRVTVYDMRNRKSGEKRVVSEIALCNKKDVLWPKVVFDGKRFLDKESLVKAVAVQLGATSPEIKKELAKREEFLKKKKPEGFVKAFWSIQDFLFGGKKDA
ncbi:MAG: ATPase, T2SS/T4P/T4SS family [Candidatus Micrarchaeota archaeon]|nr:ATPase, T2SS/T4P/T4SS family [Candidatus Micrarchaeota archaeon]